MTSSSSSSTSSGAYKALLSLIGPSLNSAQLRNELVTLFGENLPEPDIKVFPDAVYLNYQAAGLSLFLAPEEDYKPNAASLEYNRLQLKSFDVYNKLSGAKNHPFSTFPLLPLSLPTSNGTVFPITNSTTGKELVQGLGEPPRKGGGERSAAGSLDIWCEWANYGIMVEFDERGPQAWERGKDAVWKVITVFSPT